MKIRLKSARQSKAPDPLPRATKPLEGEPIVCSLKPVVKYPCLSSQPNTKTKLGRFHKSFYHISGSFDPARLKPVGLYIQVGWQDLKDKGLDEQEIFDRCLIHLNTPNPNKKPKRGRPKKIKNRYGTLMPVSASFKKDGDDEYIVAIVLTDNTKCKLFWK